MKEFSISVNDLPSVEFSDRLSVPDFAAVYFVLDASSDVLYIGSARSLRGRWLQHNKIDIFQHFGAERIAWLALDSIRAVEKQLITLMNPPLNGMGAVSFGALKLADSIG
jgi:hypothetical protein